MPEIVPSKASETVSFPELKSSNTSIDVTADIIFLTIPSATTETYRVPVGFGGLTALGTFVATGSEPPEPPTGSAQTSQENWYLS